MRRSMLKLCILICVLLSFDTDVLSKGTKKYTIHSTLERTFYNAVPENTDDNDLKIAGHVSKKSDIALHSDTVKHPVIDENEYAALEKHKRGFLANLASLLNDADLLASRKSEKDSVLNNRMFLSNNDVKLSEATASYTKNLTTDKTDNKPEIEKAENRINDSIQNLIEAESRSHKDLGLSSKNISEVKSLLTVNYKNGNSFAPVFAIYHGKLTSLGKLPETDLTQRFLNKAKHEELVTSFKNIRPGKIISDPTKKPLKNVAGSKRSFFNEEMIRKVNDRVSSKTQSNKLTQYLNSLDDRELLKPSRKNEGVEPVKEHEVAKDVVVFPDGEEAPSKAEIFNHVKGVVLDNGKFLSVKHNFQKGTTKENIDATPDEELSQKLLMEEEGPTLSIKQKQDLLESPLRGLADEGKKASSISLDSQKSVTLPVEVLRELLKKTDEKVSLESLLNRHTERKIEPAVEAEASNPDMVSKVTENSESLAALLNKGSEVKPEAPKDNDDEDPGTIEDFAAGGLKAHNEYRAKHHDEALIWSDDIAAKAQKLAETLADKKTLEIAKDLEKEGYGENVAKVWATFKNAGEAAAKMWYSQSDNYHFEDPHLDENTGQFAQVVWKSTKELGMGVAKSIDDVNNKYVYVTALYRPPGNVEAVLRENVLPTGNNTIDVYTTFFKRAGVLLSHNLAQHSHQSTQTSNKLDSKESSIDDQN